MRLTRRNMLAGMLASAAAPAWAEITRSPIPLPRPVDFHKRAAPSIASLLARADLGGQVGFAVADCADGAMREVHHSLRGMAPASTAKALTALYALDALGPEFRFNTRLLASGPVTDGTLQGDLILQGSGDPTLDTDGLAALVADLKASGVRAISGALRIDASAVPTLYEIDQGQTVYAGYNPALSGLNLNYNRVHFEWRKQGADYSVTMQARTDNLRPAVKMARMAIIARDRPLFDYTDSDGIDRWSVSRAALGNGGSRWLPVRRPADYAAEVFMTLAAAQGIRLQRGADISGADGPILAQRASPPLTVILRDMLRYSTNLTAEVVGLTASAARGAPHDTLAASAGAMNGWAVDALNMRHAGLVDHSGLGETSRLSPSDMARMMVQPRAMALLQPLLKPFALRDRNNRVIKDHPVEVHAKTGTLDFVSGLAGYVTAPDGTLLGFAIYAGDLERRAAAHAISAAQPPDAPGWNRRAKILQQGLIERWALLYSGLNTEAAAAQTPAPATSDG